MVNTPEQDRLLLPDPRLLGAAPHRPLFLAGALAVLFAMTWWTLWLAVGPLGWVPPMPLDRTGGGVHALCAR